MCGIYMVAQVLKNTTDQSPDSGEKVFEGLKRIEYRGYDSWGVAVLTPTGFKLKKDIGKLSNLGKIKFASGFFALGHTRWATHGGVTQKNAHPHLAKDGSFALVQNGVVENYQELKASLVDWGYDFVSETDTEVIVGLIELEMKKQKLSEPNTKILRNIFLSLEGRNTIAVLLKSGNIIAFRNGSPLVVGRNTTNNNIYFSSDLVSLSGEVDEYVVIQSGQMVEVLSAVLGANQSLDFGVFDTKSKKPIKFEFETMNLEKTVVDKEGYSSFMLKEIHEQAKVLSGVVAGKQKEFVLARDVIKKAQTVFVLGAGTAHLVAQHTAYLLRKIGVIAMAVASYEADSYGSLCNDKSVCIVFSQSGETADTNEVVEKMREHGVVIISAVNMPGSTLTQLSDFAFMLDVGPELAVASTKAFFGHMIWGMVLTELLCESKFSDIENNIILFEQQLRKWFTQKTIQEKIRKLAHTLVTKKHLFVLGRGDLYSSSLESALKLKEISYIHAEGFSGGELKHGVIALIEKGTPVLCLVGKDENKANMLNAISEINARGGYTIVVASEDNELFKEWVEVPEMLMGGVGEFAIVNMMTLMCIVPSQLLTCYMAEIQGFDVDKPRNLAKSVTVK